jgi:Lon protease-like protein
VPDRLRTEFPLFPLGIVALPGELVPLHIFEERYKQMIGECLRVEGEFGIVWLSDEELKTVGCACEIDRVLERMEDGRMNILVRGTRPFRVLERQGHLAYPAGMIEFLSDREEEPEPDLLETTQRAYADLVKLATDRDPSDEDLSGLDAYAMAATVDFGVQAKQELLDLRSENARLRLLTRLLRAAVKRMELVELAHERAKSNGKVRIV